MPLSESPELDSLLERKLANFREFQKGQEGVWGTISGAYLVSRGLVAAVAKDGALSTVGAHRLMMWQTVLEYQMESFFLLIDRRLDEGLALLRMAAELARDVARISDDAVRKRTFTSYTTWPQPSESTVTCSQVQTSSRTTNHLTARYSLLRCRT